MSFSSWTVEFEAAVAAPRLFKAVLEWHNVAPKVAPELFTSGAFIEGGGSVGSVRLVHLSSLAPYSHVKQRLDFVDNDKYEFKQTVIEGGVLGTKVETLSMHIEMEPKGNNASAVKIIADYKLLPGVTNDSVETVKELVEKVIKFAESYLLINPDAYV